MNKKRKIQVLENENNNLMEEVFELRNTISTLKSKLSEQDHIIKTFEVLYAHKGANTMTVLDEIEFCKDCPYSGEPNGCNREEGVCQAHDSYFELLDTYESLLSSTEMQDFIRFKKIFKDSGLSISFRESNLSQAEVDAEIEELFGPHDGFKFSNRGACYGQRSGKRRDD